jgi:SSS family solute:Na+ symporter
VWTFDIYQSYLRRSANDAHYLWMGRMATVFGVLVSMATAYAAMRFNNINDMLQLVFSFVNAPLFATFLLGMFWKRTTGHGAFWGLLAGTIAAALHYEMTGVAGTASLLPKIAAVHSYRSDMAQNFWGAIVAWTLCFGVTAAVSAATRPKAAADLHGLVYGLTRREPGDRPAWYHRPGVLAVGVLACTLALNILFW